MRHFWIGSLLMLAAAQAVAGCPGEDDVWADQCFEAAGAGERLKRAYLKKVKFDKSGHAVLTREPMEMAAIDRQGVIKVPAIYFVGDFDFKDAEAGIGRFGAPRCGYFNVKTYQIVIPPTYDQCQAFRNGEAVVCNDCIRYCTEPECQNNVQALIEKADQALYDAKRGGKNRHCAAQPESSATEAYIPSHPAMHSASVA
eukprot:gene37147-45827_t